MSETSAASKGVDVIGPVPMSPLADELPPVTEVEVQAQPALRLG